MQLLGQFHQPLQNQIPLNIQPPKGSKGGGLGTSGPFDGSLSKDISPEQPDLTGVIPVRNGSPLEQLAYEVRDTRLIAVCRGKAVELQTWLVARFDEHMTTELGLPEWISTLAEFDIVERGQLRGVFHYAGCIHDSGSCPDDAPVYCSACEGKDQT